MKSRFAYVGIRVKDLQKSIEKGTFREDLYYRLNVIPIQVPPLRDRKTDIPMLKDYFLKRLGGRRRQDRKRMKKFSGQSIEYLMRHDWPGNIREFENMIERLSVLVEGDVIDIDQFTYVIQITSADNGDRIVSA